MSDPTDPKFLVRDKLPPWLGKEIPLKRFRLVPYETGHPTIPASALIVFSSPEHPERSCHGNWLVSAAGGE